MDDLTLTEAKETARIMARDRCTAQEAVDRYFGPLEPRPDARSMPPETMRRLEAHQQPHDERY